MISNPTNAHLAADIRPFTDEKNRANFDINANLRDINADLSSKGEGFVRI